MNAMLFLFRAIDCNEWQTIDMGNMQDKMKIIEKLKRKDF